MPRLCRFLRKRRGAIPPITPVGFAPASARCGCSGTQPPRQLFHLHRALERTIGGVVQPRSERTATRAPTPRWTTSTVSFSYARTRPTVLSRAMALMKLNRFNDAIGADRKAVAPARQRPVPISAVQRPGIRPDRRRAGGPRGLSPRTGGRPRLRHRPLVATTSTTTRARSTTTDRASRRGTARPSRPQEQSRTAQPGVRQRRGIGTRAGSPFKRIP